MTGEERDIIDRIDGVVRTVGSLTPKNPCDVAAIAANLRMATTASKEVARAIQALRFGRFADARRRLDAAALAVADPSWIPEDPR